MSRDFFHCFPTKMYIFLFPPGRPRGSGAPPGSLVGIFFLSAEALEEIMADESHGEDASFLALLFHNISSTNIGSVVCVCASGACAHTHARTQAQHKTVSTQRATDRSSTTVFS